MSDDRGGVRLLDDTHASAKNPWDGDVVGWVPPNGAMGLVQLRGWAMIRGVHWKLGPDDEPQVLYDQPFVFEAPGVVVAPVQDGKVCLVKVMRMVGPRLCDEEGQPYGGDYVKAIDKAGRWGELMESLGEPMWQCPMGLVHAAKRRPGESMDDLIVRVAGIEAAEEVGCVLGEVRITGPGHANPTFFPHAQTSAVGRVEEVVDIRPEKLEHILDRRFFSYEELSAMIASGEITCNGTITALARIGVRMGERPAGW